MHGALACLGPQFQPRTQYKRLKQVTSVHRKLQNQTKNNSKDARTVSKTGDGKMEKKDGDGQMAHIQRNKTKQNKAKSGTLLQPHSHQSHIWDQEIITVSIPFCSPKINVTSKSHTSLPSLSALNTSSACTPPSFVQRNSTGMQHSQIQQPSGPTKLSSFLTVLLETF